MNTLLTAGPGVGQPGTLLRAWLHLKDHVVPHHRNHYQPHILHHRALAAFSVLLLTIKIVSLSAVEFAPGQEVTAAAITPASVLELTNKARTSSGISELKYNVVLEKAAQMKAEDMLKRQYFAHNTPDGKTPWTFFEAVGYKYTSAGENLAVHFTDVEPLQDAWMNSPGHRANILNSSFKEMGVGIARGQFEGHDSIFVVEEFGSPQGVTAPASQPVVQKPVAPAPPSQMPAPKLIRPQSAAAVEATPPIAPEVREEQPTPASEELAIYNASATPEDAMLQVTALTSGNAVKVLLLYGQQSQFFRLNADGVWTAQLPVKIAQAADSLSVKAYDIAGKEVTTPLGSIAPTFKDRYATVGSVEGASISFFGQKLPVKPLEQKAYLSVIALLLTVLVIAIAVHKHLQHVRLVANTAFVVMFATLLLLF